MHRNYTVRAEWDDDAKVWFVAESDIPGLATEAPTTTQLSQHITELAPQLIELNEQDGTDVPVDLLWNGSQKLCLAG